MTLDLENEKKRLEARIVELESQIAPIQKELRELRDRYTHVIALIPEKNNKLLIPMSESLPKGYWINLCRKHNFIVGGDSAHRVIARKAPQLHKSIQHLCDIDGKMYPEIEKSK